MQLIWFRNDLRVIDNLALQKALVQEQPVVAVYIHCPTTLELQGVGLRRQWFHLSHVQAIFQSLASQGIPCLYREVADYHKVPEVLAALIVQLPLAGLSFSREVGQWEQQRDEAVRALFAAKGLTVLSVADDSILPVESVTQKNGQPYKVFTPFKKAWYTEFEQVGVPFYEQLLDKQLRHKLLAALNNSPAFQVDSGLARLEQRLFTLSKSVSPQIRELWPIGHAAALQRLADFKDSALTRYDTERDFPNRACTSGLSPYLASGVVSARQLFLEALACKPSLGRDVWLSELIWRDFYRQIMYNFPRVSKDLSFNQEYDDLSWRTSTTDLKAWQTGNTGVPLVDAGMRQLNEIGWMHNRVRMVTAMFLSKNLFLDWRLGEHYFMQQLLDGDFPSNNGGWQWSASVGTDAAPYFRVFNPLTQAERFDPECIYIKRFVPELRTMSPKAILKADQHQSTLKKAGYAELIVDVKASRVRAIETFIKFRATLESHE